MTSQTAPPFFSHAEQITIAPLNNHVTVRLEATTVLNETASLENEEKIDTTFTTPFPHFVMKQLVKDYGISRLFVSSASSSSTHYNVNHVLHDDYSTGPSGISVVVELRDATMFMPLLRALSGYRFSSLAPIDAIQQSRLHRHVYKTITDDTGNVQLQVILPLEGSAAASEGVQEFARVGNVCGNRGLFSSEIAKSLSQILQGDSTYIDVSQQERRVMWLEIQSECDEGTTFSTCSITLKRGVQYGVVVENEDSTSISVSRLVPFTHFQECSLSGNRTQLSAVTRRGDSSSEHAVEEIAVDDWDVDTMMNLSSSHFDNQYSGQIYGNRVLKQPNGIANSGRIVTSIQSSMNCPVTVQVLDVLPNFIRPLWDTWSLTTMEKPLLSVQEDGTVVVEYNVTLFPKTELQTTMDYEPVLLPFQDFPADPNRGMELPPTMFTVMSDCIRYNPIVLYSSPLLLMPPVPDMSMPFNVISLTCTLYAFVIGSLANLMIRKASQQIKRKLNPEENKSKLQKLKERIRSKFGRFRKKGAEASDDKTDGSDEKNAPTLTKDVPVE